jgi:hypothetical protein
MSFNAEVYRTGCRSASDVILGLAPLFHITGLVAQLALSTPPASRLCCFIDSRSP